MTGFECFPRWILGDLRTTREYRLLNALDYRNTVLEMVNKRLVSYKWGGLPLGCSDRVAELSLLFRTGFTLFTLDHEETFQLLPSTPTADINSSADWLYAYVYGANGFTRQIKLFLPGISENPAVREGIHGKVSKLYEGVFCRENPLCYPFIYYILLAAKRKTNCMRAMDTALETMKVPYVIKCDETLKDSIRDLYKKVRENDPLIISSKGLDLQAVEVLQTGVNPQILAEFREQYEFINSQILEKMGVFHNSQPDKQAHILEDELHADDMDTQSALNLGLTYRRKFCDDAREAFGLDITVEVRDQGISSVELEDDGDEDGEGVTGYDKKQKGNF